MEVTPHKASEKIDEVIQRLNGYWDLKLPRLHGFEATKAAESSELAKRCSSRIRALCWKGNVNIDGVIEDFEERAAQQHSNWTCQWLTPGLHQWKERIANISSSFQTSRHSEKVPYHRYQLPNHSLIRMQWPDPADSPFKTASG